jgi:hypothetical protein
MAKAEAVIPDIAEAAVVVYEPDVAQAEVVIYEPPAPGLPCLVVTIASTGVKVVSVKSRTEARVLISQRRERRHTSDRQKPSPVTCVAAPI